MSYYQHRAMAIETFVYPFTIAYAAAGFDFKAKKWHTNEVRFL